ncbi:NUDIX hydrolase [Patescibacteria group bacterium]|nr:NUDIX hydrolase [Patescibacteria group bacterium]
MNKFSAGIHVLVNCKNKYLLLKRGKKARDEQGCWDFPGGGIEFGEQPLKTATRETKEETGLKITNLKLINVWAAKWPGNYWSVELLASAKTHSQKVRLSPEHSEFKWLTISELKKINPRSAHLLNFIKYLKSK